MGRGRKKNTQQTRVYNAVTMNEDEDVRTFVSRVGGLPSRVWLPPFDIGVEIEAFAKAHGYTTKNVSTLFDRHKANGAAVCDAFMIVEQRAKSNPNTMQYIMTSFTNMEAGSGYLNALLVNLKNRGVQTLVYTESTMKRCFTRSYSWVGTICPCTASDRHRWSLQRCRVLSQAASAPSAWKSLPMSRRSLRFTAATSSASRAVKRRWIAAPCVAPPNA
jgi:hypothetical protein